MHELTIARSIVQAAETQAQQRGATRIVRITCRIGCLRQVDAELLQESYAVARMSTLARDADLTVTSVGMRLQCHACRQCSELDGWAFECPRCGSEDIALSGGDELELTSLALEVPDDPRNPREKPVRNERACCR